MRAVYTALSMYFTVTLHVSSPELTEEMFRDGGLHEVGVRGIVAGALALAALAISGGGVAQAQTGPVLENGKTKAVYDYAPRSGSVCSSRSPGSTRTPTAAMDWVTIDIIRPSEGWATNKMPAIIDPSPYYTTGCRGNETQCMADWNNDGVNDRWPLFYDNYFVPRGYAYILAQMNGTALHPARLPDARRPRRHRGREVGHRLAQRPRQGLQRRQPHGHREGRRTGTTARAR